VAPVFRIPPRRAVRPAVALAGALLALSLAALPAPAGAVITEGFGLQRRQAVSAEKLLEGGPLQYHGGLVLHSSDAYAIFWDPIGNYRGDWERLISRYFHDVGVESGHLGDIFAVNSQYGDGIGHAANQSTFRGSYKDEAPYPKTENCTEPGTPGTVCLTDKQIQTELKRLIKSGELPGATGPAVYYVLTPPGVTVCTGAGSPSTCSYSKQLEKEVTTEKKAESGICGYHSVANQFSGNPIYYAVQPWIAGNAGRITQRNPLITATPTPDVLACQDSKELQEPNQLNGLNPFGEYEEGLADVIINDLSIEQSNIVTNPLLTGWYQTSTNAEQSDVCQFNFGPPPKSPPPPNAETHAANFSNETINNDPYYIQWAFNSSGVIAGNGFYCWQGVTLEPFFTAPNPVNSGDVVGFNATESNITLDAKAIELPPNEPYTAPIYNWSFGDGSTASGTEAASQFHSYQYGGEYTVTLTVTDGGGNVSKTTRTITVVGPPPPSPAPGPSGSGSPGAAAPGAPGSSSGGAGSQPGQGGTQPSIPGPVATQAVVSRSLAKIMRRGLQVRYTVNEQVTGRFEVLLASAIARRAGIRGPLAAGLPEGAPPAIVIGKALLVTLKGGHSTVKIQFGKHTAERLHRLHKVTVTLRLIVRNAARSPQSTTVLSSVTLGR
jgi:PKD domain